MAFRIGTRRLWQLDLQKVLALDVPHLSAYALTIEPDTAFGRWQKKGKLAPADEAIAAEQFEGLALALTGDACPAMSITKFQILPNRVNTPGITPPTGNGNLTWALDQVRTPIMVIRGSTTWLTIADTWPRLGGANCPQL